MIMHMKNGEKLVDEGARGKRVFRFVAVTLVVFFSFVFILSFVLSRQIPLEAQTGEQLKTITQPNPTTNSNERGTTDNSTSKPSENSITSSFDAGTCSSPGDSITPSPTTTPQNNSLITEEQAIQIAMPTIEQYANEHNRTITTVKATFYPNFKTGSWPSVSLSVSFPAWLVEASYARAPEDSGEQYWIFGYQVIVQAETGQIYSSNAAGIM
jgi:cytoskeletal protein RodZ